MNSYSNNVINLSFRVNGLTEEEKDYVVKNYTSENIIDLKETLNTKKVRPVVGKLMISLGVDVQYWQREYDFFHERNILVISEIETIFTVLQKQGIRKAFAYENFGALLLSGTDTTLYSSGDVDIFADVSQKEQIEYAMASLGYLPTRDVYDNRKIMTEFLKVNGIIRVNFDWIVLRRMFSPVDICIDSIIDWGNLKEYKNTHILLPSKEALLYLCLLRIAVHGFSRSPDVRLYIDVQNIACLNPDWHTVVSWAQNDGFVTKVVTVAYIAHHLNGVDIPDFVLNIAENDKDAMRIVNLCYDNENRTLKYDPSGMTLFKVESASDNRSLFGEVFKLLFPSRRFLKLFYEADSDNRFRKYINYYLHLIGK